MGKVLKTILVLGDLTRAGVVPVLHRLQEDLAHIARLRVVDLSRESVEGKCRADLVVVLGGDGTILSVARCLGDQQVPVLGINLGKLGYLAEFSPEEVPMVAEDIAKGRLRISKRMMLRVDMCDGKECFSSVAVNDVVIQAGPPFRMIELRIRVDGEELTTIKGDGVIVSTGTGSTGHNISAGGPVVDYSLGAIVLTPLNPHSLTHRPLVVAGSSAIDITAPKVNKGTTVIVDGQLTRTLSSRSKIEIHQANRPFLLVRNRRFSRWYMLQNKLNWGVGPNYNP